MKLLLDTHVYLWAVSDSKRLPAAGRKLMLEADDIFVSAASIWEIAIKRRLGKIDGDPAALAAAITESGFHSLPITSQHAAGVELLPDHHRDPFDRLLVAQAVSEPLRLITADAQLAVYSELVTVL